jgi:hypothetical protein
MTSTRRLAASALSIVAVIGVTSTAAAAPGVLTKKPSAPAAGKYVMHSPGNWTKATFTLKRKRGVLTLTKMAWTLTAKASSETNGICPKGDYSLVGTLPVRLLSTNGAHHQKVWAVGKHYSEGVTGDKTKVLTPDGTKKSRLLIDFKPNLTTRIGQYEYSNVGSVSNANSMCGYDFTHHHS